MKRLPMILVSTAFVLGSLGGTAHARPEYDDYYDVFPFRLVAYPLHAAGTVLEWTVTRPLHAFVNLPYVRDLVGEKVEDGLDRETKI